MRIAKKLGLTGLVLCTALTFGYSQTSNTVKNTQDTVKVEYQTQGIDDLAAAIMAATKQEEMNTMTNYRNIKKEYPQMNDLAVAIMAATKQEEMNTMTNYRNIKKEYPNINNKKIKKNFTRRPLLQVPHPSLISS
jgi:hypothetical protein